MNEDTIQKAIDDGTFFEKLIQQTKITPKDAGNGKMTLTFEMPQWFNLLENNSQQNILNSLEKHAPIVMNQINNEKK